jgi:hypothetical protein
MSCESFRESLVSRLYAELDPAENDRLDSHLEGCDACRSELEGLSATRARLRDAEPDVPPAPRVVVLSPRPAAPRYLSFAAGIGWGAVLLSAGLVAGWNLAPAEPRPTEIAGDSSAGPMPRAVPARSDDADTRATLEALDAMRRKIDDQERRIQALTATPAMQARLTRQEYESGLARLRNDVDQQQADNLRFFFDEVRGVEERTNGRINETRQALHHIVLANDPRINAQ